MWDCDYTPELSILQNTAHSFYLTGGTALARFYFNHRFSDDFFLAKENPLGKTKTIRPNT